MSGDPKFGRETALRCTERVMTDRAPELGIQLIRLSKSYLKRSIELVRNMALWPWTARSQLRPVSAALIVPRMGQEYLEDANRQVAESERIIADWSVLIDRMRAEGRDVTVACHLLETFKGNLRARSANRDLIQRTVAEGRE